MSPLRQTLGIWAEEIDSLTEKDSNTVAPAADNPLGLQGPYRATDLCDLIHLEGATQLAAYGSDFYAGRAALTVNPYGKGQAYYVASRNEPAFQRDFFRALSRQLNLKRVLAPDLPEGVTAQLRTDGKNQFVFLLNFNDNPKTVDLGGEKFIDMLTDAPLAGTFALPGYGSMVLRKTV